MSHSLTVHGMAERPDRSDDQKRRQIRIGASIRARRIAAGLSQSKVAGAIHKDIKTVVRIEGGKAMPSGDTLEAMADLFRCTIDELMGRGDPGPAMPLADGPLESLEDIVVRIRAMDRNLGTALQLGNEAIRRIGDLEKAAPKSQSGPAGRRKRA
jgi:transcriptional regulator with XRE-family HTH domain